MHQTAFPHLVNADRKCTSWSTLSEVGTLSEHTLGALSSTLKAHLEHTLGALLEHTLGAHSKHSQRTLLWQRCKLRSNLAEHASHLLSISSRVWVNFYICNMLNTHAQWACCIYIKIDSNTWVKRRKKFELTKYRDGILGIDQRAGWARASHRLRRPPPHRSHAIPTLLSAPQKDFFFLQFKFAGNIWWPFFEARSIFENFPDLAPGDTGVRSGRQGTGLVLFFSTSLNISTSLTILFTLV